jgi:hypothetical protein
VNYSSATEYQQSPLTQTLKVFSLSSILPIAAVGFINNWWVISNLWVTLLLGEQSENEPYGSDR